MIITLYHVHIVTSATTQSVRPALLYTRLHLNCYECGQTQLGSYSAPAELSVIPTTAKPQSLHMSTAHAVRNYTALILLELISVLFALIIPEGHYHCCLVPGLYYVDHHHPHGPHGGGYLCHLYDYCPLTQRGSFLGPECEPIIRFYWDPPSLRLLLAPDSRDNGFKGKDITFYRPSPCTQSSLPITCLSCETEIPIWR